MYRFTAEAHEDIELVRVATEDSSAFYNWDKWEDKYMKNQVPGCSENHVFSCSVCEPDCIFISPSLEFVLHLPPRGLQQAAHLVALKEGRMGDKAYTQDEINAMKMTRTFRDRYNKYLRKVIKGGPKIELELNKWFNEFKSSNNDKCGKCGVSKMHERPLFTRDTYNAVKNAKKSCHHIQDPICLDELYTKVPPSADSSHQLS